MADQEPFTLIEESPRPSRQRLFDHVLSAESAKSADHDLQYVQSLRAMSPASIVTAIPEYHAPLRLFAAAGLATCQLDAESDSFYSWRGYVPPAARQAKGRVGEQVHFAKFRFQWAGEAFLLYLVTGMQYILKEPRDREPVIGPSRVTDELIRAVGDWVVGEKEIVWVYDLYWSRSKQLYDEVMKASWERVILDENMKKDLTSVTKNFFDSKDVYDDLGVPWKRGLLFHGPPGNGKTISIKALMHTLLDLKDPIPALYVKSAPRTFDIQQIFARARQLAPCMLILEDVETIVTPQTRSYFFNEMDGLSNNSGIFVVASTNFLDRLDPGLSKRPSRFDRKYLFPLPNEHERTLYCEFWRQKLEGKKSARVDFPQSLCPAMAHITAGFSFAFMQEAFVASLLELARREDGDGVERVAVVRRDLNDYELWRLFKRQVEALRKEVDDEVGGLSGMAVEGECVCGETGGEYDGRLGVESRRSRGRPGPLSGPVRREWDDMLTARMDELQMEDKVLPDLPYPQKVHEDINSRAIIASIG